MPSEGGPAWRELASVHFTMWTDASSERGRDLLQRMEWLRSVIYGVAFPELPPGGQTFVVALADLREARVFMRPAALAFASPANLNPLGIPMIVLPADSWGDKRVVTHELAHAISYNAIHHQPTWFAEGLATYFEKIGLDMTRGHVDVGNVEPAIRDQLARNRGRISIRPLFACQRPSCAENYQFYANAWAVYAYLHYKHPTELARFERELDGDEPANAWKTAMGDLTDEKLEDDVNSWLWDGHFTISSFTIEKRSWKIVERPLSDSDVYVVRALLLVNSHPKASEIATDIAAALQRDPNNVWAHVIDVHAVKHELSPADARALAVTHPLNFWSWLLLAKVTQAGEEHDQAFARACALMVQNPALVVPKTCATAAPPPTPSRVAPPSAGSPPP
jgi:hypothetical protein